MKSKPLVVGAGWAGLAAAVTLAEHNIPCTLIEAAPQAGGRARDVNWNNQHIDNGQHLFLGAYQQLYTLLAKFNIRFDDYFLRQPLSLTLKCSIQDVIFKSYTLPIPFNMLMGWLFARGFSYQDKLAAIRFCYHLKKSQFKLSHDVSVKFLLQQHKQSERLINTFWAPLCVAALSTDIDNASANVFMRVLHDSFHQSTRHADLIFAKKSLSQIFPEPAIRYLQDKGCELRFNTRLQTFHIEQDKIVGCNTNQGDLTTPAIILATSPFSAVKLTQSHPALASLHHQLTQLTPETIITVYLQYPSTTKLPHIMTGLTQSLCQWIFDRGYMGQPGLIAAVISSNQAVTGFSNEHIGQTVVTELAQFFPHLGAVNDIKVIREKQAAFQCHPHIHALRPANRTAISGLWLAGDYTQTDYPACLEGAIKSGIQCGQQLAMQYIN